MLSLSLALAAVLAVQPGPIRSDESPAIRTGRAARTVDFDGTELELFTFKPENWGGERLLLVLHGTHRNADYYRDGAIALAERFDALIVAPRFDRRRFPSRLYQRGGLLTRDGEVAPREEWTYAYIPKIAAYVRGVEQRPDLRLWIVGHSAGGQFVVRMAAFQDTGAECLVAVNPGSHLFPTRSLPFGYGFGGLPEALSDDATLRRYLAQPLTFYIGTADDHPDDYFDMSPAAMEQGEGRWQRGRACFEAGRALAVEKGWAFNWQLVEAEGVDHNSGRMFAHPAVAIAFPHGEPSAAPATPVAGNPRPAETTGGTVGAGR